MVQELLGACTNVRPPGFGLFLSIPAYFPYNICASTLGEDSKFVYPTGEIREQLHQITIKRHKTVWTYIHPVLLYTHYKTWDKLQYHKTRLGMCCKEWGM